MKLAIVTVMLTLAAPAWAQTGNSTESAPPRRAPLANIDDLEPAVNVGAPRVAAVAPPVAPPAAAESPSPPPPRPAAGRAVDSLDLGATSITGNAELPKVLYIVPWKKSDLGDLVGRPVNTLLDEVLSPVDPEVFERHLTYYETLNGASQQE